MLDIKFIRENKEVIALSATKKKIDFDIEKLLEVDDVRKEMLVEVEELRTKQNDANQKIAQASSEEKESLIGEMKVLKEGLQEKEEKLKV